MIRKGGLFFSLFYKHYTIQNLLDFSFYHLFHFLSYTRIHILNGGGETQDTGHVIVTIYNNNDNNNDKRKEG